MKPRKARSPAILDVIDYEILKYLHDNPEGGLMGLIMKKKNLSANALVFHIHKLSDLGFVRSERLNYPRHKEKKVVLKSKGKSCYMLIKSNVVFKLTKKASEVNLK